jgi:multiple sugar transport system substrate-binding protein
MKKSSLVLSVVLMVSLLLAACGGGNAGNGTNAEGASKDGAAGKQQVSYWYYFGGQEEKAMLEQVDQFNKSQDQYEVVAQYIPFGDMKQRLSVGLMGEDLPDIVTIDNPDHASFAAAGMLEDITSRVEEWGQAANYLQGPLNSAKYDGKIYGLPYTSNTLAIFYNKDMLAAAGYESVPTTWDEFREAAKKLTTPEHYGLGFAGVKSEEGTFDFLPFLLSSGGNFDRMDSEESVRALAYLTDLIKDGSVSKEIINLTNADTKSQFAAGKLAMMVNGPWNIAGVKADAPNLNFGIAPIPIDQKAASSLGGENLAIIKGNNVDGAWEFLKFVSEPKQLESFLVQTGYFPPRKDLNTEHWEKDELLKPFLEQMESAQPRGPHPKWPEISLAIQEAYQKAFSLTVEPKQAASEAAQKINEAMGQ